MKIQQLFLRNVRSLKNLDLDFRDPVTGKPMSRIVLAGANGSGKTTILDGLFALLSAAADRKEGRVDFPFFASKAQLQVVFEVEFPNHFTTWLSISFGTGGPISNDMAPSISGNSIGIAEGISLDFLEPGDISSFPYPSHFDRLAMATEKASSREGEAIGALLYFPHNRNLPSVSQGELGYEPKVYQWAYKYQATEQWKGSLESYLFSLNYLDLEDRDRKLTGNRFKHAVELVNSILGDKRIARIERGRVVVETSTRATHGLDSLSSGEKQLTLLLVEIMRHVVPSSVILIDEPEISLHPAWQRGLVVALDKIIEQYDAQVIMATHSPEIAGMVLPHEVKFLSDLNAPLGEWKPENEVLA